MTILHHIDNGSIIEIARGYHERICSQTKMSMFFCLPGEAGDFSISGRPNDDNAISPTCLNMGDWPRKMRTKNDEPVDVVLFSFF